MIERTIVTASLIGRNAYIVLDNNCKLVTVIDGMLIWICDDNQYNKGFR